MYQEKEISGVRAPTLVKGISFLGLVYTIALSAIFPCYSSRLSCSLTSPTARQNVRNNKERQQKYIHKGNPFDMCRSPSTPDIFLDNGK